MYMFNDVCACEIRRREVNEACRRACPDGIAPSKVSTSDDACDDHFFFNLFFFFFFYQREVRDSVVSTIVRVHVYELCLTQSLGL